MVIFSCSCSRHTWHTWHTSIATHRQRLTGHHVPLNDEATNVRHQDEQHPFVAKVQYFSQRHSSSYLHSVKLLASQTLAFSWAWHVTWGQHPAIFFTKSSNRCCWCDWVAGWAAEVRATPTLIRIHRVYVSTPELTSARNLSTLRHCHWLFPFVSIATWTHSSWHCRSSHPAVNGKLVSGSFVTVIPPVTLSFSSPLTNLENIQKVPPSPRVCMARLSIMFRSTDEGWAATAITGTMQDINICKILSPCPSAWCCTFGWGGVHKLPGHSQTAM